MQDTEDGPYGKRVYWGVEPQVVSMVEKVLNKGDCDEEGDDKPGNRGDTQGCRKFIFGIVYWIVYCNTNSQLKDPQEDPRDINLLLWTKETRT